MNETAQAGRRSSSTIASLTKAWTAASSWPGWSRSQAASLQPKR